MDDNPLILAIYSNGSRVKQKKNYKNYFLFFSVFLCLLRAHFLFPLFCPFVVFSSQRLLQPSSCPHLRSGWCGSAAAPNCGSCSHRTKVVCETTPPLFGKPTTIILSLVILRFENFVSRFDQFLFSLVNKQTLAIGARLYFSPGISNSLFAKPTVNEVAKVELNSDYYFFKKKTYMNSMV